MKTFFLKLAAAAALALAFACGGDNDAPLPQPDTAVTAVAIEGKMPRMMVGDKLTLNALVMPASAANKGVTWESSDTHVATVSGDGVRATVTALAAGEASITVRTAEGGFTDTFRMFVSDGTVAVTGVTLDRAALDLVPNGSGLLTASLWPSNATNQTITWTSSNTSFVTVKGNGPTAMVTAVAAGSAVITAKTIDGDYTADCTVTVATYTVQPTGVSLNNATLQVRLDNTGTTLTATVTPINAQVTPTWTSSITGVATVTPASNGLSATVRPVSPGSTIITVTAGAGANAKTATCAVSVFSIPTTDITLSPTSMSIAVNEALPITATILPANTTDNKVLTWTSDAPTVATVAPASSTGSPATVTVTGAAVGSANITARSANGVWATCRVTVAPVAATGVALPASFKATLGRTKQLTASIQPANASNKNASWSSSDTSIATVTGTDLVGSVTGVAVGNCTITVTTEDGAFTATCPVEVSVEPVTYAAGNFGLYVDGQPNTAIGRQALRDVAVDGSGNVHAVGIYTNPGGAVEHTAVWYKNGVRTLLPLTHGADDEQAEADGIAINGSDVYIVGNEVFEGGPWGYGKVARLWKNGVFTPLQNTDETGDIWSTAFAVKVFNGNVFVAGHDYADQRYPCIWKNGVQTVCDWEEDFYYFEGSIEDMCILSDGTIYVIVQDYWMAMFGIDDGDRSVWRVSPDLSTWTYVLGWQDDIVPIHLFADGMDYWVAGTHYDDDEGHYWKNGTPGTGVTLQHPAGASVTEADDIFVLDGSVYAIGLAEYYDDDTYRVVQWKDGLLVTGDKEITTVWDAYEFLPQPYAIFLR